MELSLRYQGMMAIMATNSDKKLTRYTSAVTVVTADVMNALYGGEYGHNLALYAEDQYHPRVAGHIHDGTHADGHASKVLLTNSAHVRGALSHANLGGTEGTNTAPAVHKDNIKCWPEDVYGPHGEGYAIPLYEEDPDTGDRCYYLDLSMMIGGEDTHIQYNKDGEFAGDAGLVYDYQNTRVGIGTDNPGTPLHIQSDTNTANIWIYEKYDGTAGPEVFLTKSRGNGFAQDGDTAGGIYAGGRVTDGAGGYTNQSAAGIQFKIDGVPDPGGDDCPGEIRFLTRPSGGNSLVSPAHNRLVIRSDGNVGIGTLTPSVKLDVNGDGVFTGDLTVSGDGNFCGGQVKLYGAPQNASPSGCPVNNMVAFFDGDIDVTGNIDPTGIIFSEVDPEGNPGVPTGEGKGALFVAEAGSVDQDQRPLIENKLYYKNKDGDITELGAPATPSPPSRSVQFNAGGQFAGADSIRISSRLDLGVGVDHPSEPLRRLHVKEQEEGVPPVRINNLTRGQGEGVVWDPRTGDLFYRPMTQRTSPTYRGWPELGGDIILTTEDIGKFIIIGGEWDGRSSVVIPHVPRPPEPIEGDPNPPLPDPIPYATGDVIIIKNMTTFQGGREKVATESGATDTTSGSYSGYSVTLDGMSTMATSDTDDDLTLEPISNEANPAASSGVSVAATSVSADDLAAVSSGGVTVSGVMNTSSGTVSGTLSASAGNMNNYQSSYNRQQFIPIRIIGDDSRDTLDGEPLSAGYILGPKHTITLTCVVPHETMNHWFCWNHYHPHTSQYDMPAVAVIRAFRPNPDNADEMIPVESNDILTTGTTVTYNGSLSYDSDYDPIRQYNWRIIKSDGEVVGVFNTAEFSITYGDSFAGQQVSAELVVVSNNVSSDPAYHYCSIERTNEEPTAVISGETSGTVGVEVRLDGSSSFDPDGDSLVYLWRVESQPDGEEVILDGTGPVETFVPTVEGFWQISLEVTDGYGGSDKAFHDISVIENQAPNIGIYGDNPLTVNQTISGAYTIEDDILNGVPFNASFGAWANDVEDTNLSWEDISVEGLPFSTAAPGEFSIKYSVVDSYGNYAEAIRTIIVKANEVPQVIMCGDNVVIKEGDIYTEADDNAQGEACNYSQGAAGWDWEDGELSVTVTPSTGSWPIEGTEVGEYYVRYTVVDSFGQEASIERTITCTTNNPPNIKLVGERYVTFVANPDGGFYDDPGATADDGDGLNITGDIQTTIYQDSSVIDGPISLSFPGVYTIDYSVTDNYNDPVSTQRTVTVEPKNLPPTIENFVNSEPANINRPVLIQALIHDPNVGETLDSYEFSLADSPPNSGVTLNDFGFHEIDVSTMTVTASLLTPTPGLYTVKLAVSDGIDTVTETLVIDVKEDSTNSPDWKAPDPSNYEHSATIAVGVVLNENDSLFSEPGDLLAAFDVVSGDIRGVGIQGEAPTGKYAGELFYSIIMLSNTSSGELMSFKYYDASEGKILDIAERYTFLPDDILGSFENPFIFHIGAPRTDEEKARLEAEEKARLEAELAAAAEEEEKAIEAARVAAEEEARVKQKAEDDIMLAEAARQEALVSGDADAIQKAEETWLAVKVSAAEEVKLATDAKLAADAEVIVAAEGLAALAV